MTEAVTAPSGQTKSCRSCGASSPAEAVSCQSCNTPFTDEAPSGPNTDRSPVTAAPDGSAADAPPKLTNLESGETLLGQWKLESKIGEGGMGNVFLATELKLGRKVAVKALFVDNMADETVKRFEREAQVMGKLDHPNIVTLYAVGRHRDVPFLVMRYLEGGSLWDLLDANGGRLTPEQLLPVVKQLCSALGYIHGKNLIHRDLKPSNIFISPQGKVTLLDLGLARGHTTALTRTGIIWGTPDFMAPEQIVGEKQLDGRADLYALGVVLYRMISNEPPFPDEDEQNLMRAHLTRPRPDIAKVWPQASATLSLVLQKAMAIKPEDRYQTAEEFSQAFERAVTVREQSTRAVPPPAPAAAPTIPVPPVAAPPPRASVGAMPTQSPQPVVPAPAPPAPLAKPAVTTAPPVSHAAKGKVIDELDDDATELGELPAELMELINSDAPAAPAKPPEPKASVPKKPASIPPKPAASPGPVPEPSAPNRRSGVTAYDRPPTGRPLPPASAGPYDSATQATQDGLRPVPSAAGTVTDAEPDTGPDAAVIVSEPGLEARSSGPMMVKTGDIEPDEDDADMKTVVGASVNIPEDVGVTTVIAPANEATKAVPAPRVSAPRPSTGTQRAVPPRKSSVAIPAQRKETTAVTAKKNEEPVDESPPWMHPYVLVTGGLLLLALGFLIGVLLR